jgi:hypothetical protein
MSAWPAKLHAKVVSCDRLQVTTPKERAGQCVSNPRTVGPNSIWCQCADGFAGDACSMPYLNLR